MLLPYFIAAGLAAVHPIHPPAERSVAMGPAALTYPEIAARLSVEGRRVQCGAALAHRAAVVSLRGRSWAGACDLLAQGLDIRFRPHPDLPGTWLMEPDPDAAAREKEMRRRLAAKLRDAVAEETKPFASTLHEPIHLLMERSSRLERELEVREKTDPELRDPATVRLAEESQAASKTGDPFVQVAARLAGAIRLRAYDDAVAGPQPFQAIDVQRLANVPAICRLMLNEMARTATAHPPEADGAANFGGNPLAGDDGMAGLLRSVAEGHISLAHRIRFDPANLRVTVQQLYLFGEVLPLRHGITADPVGEGGVDALLDRLDETGSGTALKERAETDRWRTSPAATRAIKVSASQRITSMSQLVELWASQTGGEVVMELAPLREAIDLSPAADESDSDAPEARPPSDFQTTLAAKLGPESGLPWSCRESAGALLVRNRLSFIDRTRRFPLRALLALERDTPNDARQDEAPDGIESHLTLGRLARFHQACTAEENAELAGVNFYRGVDTTDLTSGRFAAVLSRLTNRDRAIVERSLAATGVAEVPLNGFSGRDIQAIAASFRAFAFADNGIGDEYLLPEFERQLWAGMIRIERQDAMLSVTLRLPFIDGSRDFSDAVTTRLAWEGSR